MVARFLKREVYKPIPTVYIFCWRAEAFLTLESISFRLLNRREITRIVCYGVAMEQQQEQGECAECIAEGGGASKWSHL